MAADDRGRRPEPNDQKVALVAAFVDIGAGAGVDRSAALHEPFRDCGSSWKTKGFQADFAELLWFDTPRLV